MSIVLPTKKVKVERVNPKRLIIYSKPKTGKTTAFAGLKNNLILDLENGSVVTSLPSKFLPIGVFLYSLIAKGITIDSNAVTVSTVT